jgi:hypothetical protein
MGLFSKSPRKPAAAPGPSPLSAKQRELLEQEQKLKAEIERKQQFVANAPKRAAEIQREQRDELLRRAATMHQGARPTSIVDRRYSLDANVAAPAQQKRMRAERRQGRLMFFILLLTLAGAILYLYYTVTQG